VKGPVTVVCPPAEAAGYRLAGLAPRLAADGDEPAVVLRELLALPPGQRPTVLLVAERLEAALPPAARRELRRDPLLAVVPVPGPAAGRPAPEAFLLEILRQAIGYRVRLR
jgi:vacuolar-type H+-ATPase subunit F/Vma7